MDDRFLRLAFVGDVCLNFLRDASKDATEFPEWTAIRQEIGEHDLFVGNLECCLVDGQCSERARQQSMAVSVAAAAATLRALGFSDLCLANNHAMDCGPEAVPVVRACLSSIGIRGFGVGSDLDEAEEIAFAERNGCKVAFVGACDQSEYDAANNRAGIAPIKKSRLGRRVREAAAQASLVIVTLHADLEFSDAPGPWRQRLSRWLIDQGAHLVIQHHPHVLQGIETYKEGLIAYSLGNFIFRLRGNRYQERRHGVFDSMVLVVDADLRGVRPKLTYRTIPVHIEDDHMPHCVTGSSRQEAMHRIQALSALLLDKKEYRRTWFRRCQMELTQRASDIYYSFRRGHFARGAGEAWRLAARRENWGWLLGLVSLGYL